MTLILPSLLQTKLGGTSWDSHYPAWWGKQGYDAWGQEDSHQDWLSRTTDIPDIKQFLEVVHPTDATHWLNVNGFFLWHQPHAADVDKFDVDRREVWLRCIGYFVNKSEATYFVQWATNADLQGGLHGSSDLHGVFVGEYGWSPAFRHSNEPSDINPKLLSTSDWQRSIRPASQTYHSGISSFDCSVDESMDLLLPHNDFTDHLGLKWHGVAADFLDEQGKLAAFEPAVHQNGPTTLLLRKDLVEQFLAEQNKALVWIVEGEKWIIGGQSTHEFRGALKILGVYQHTDQGVDGQPRFQFDPPRGS